MGECLASPLRAAFTIHILSLNSPAVVSNHRPCRVSNPKIYSGIGEIYTVYCFGGKCPIPNVFWAFFTLTALPLEHLSQQESQETTQGYHKSQNIQFHSPPVPEHIVHSLGTSELLIVHVMCVRVQDSGVSQRTRHTDMEMKIQAKSLFSQQAGVDSNSPDMQADPEATSGIDYIGSLQQLHQSPRSSTTNRFKTHSIL